ncbi:AP2/ERF domain-containing transcription factor [Heracleum sosnowskyi]|uniref:AP2/ERF domain-containing transcription factor n=1 Tax=Heracleum sosnowskyi TaxID=360622 RepID=A0AAD8HWD5_9APIA|nr:AP2/ERF domain-containing transcription factor [Heracleum sosnowskyi]
MERQQCKLCTRSFFNSKALAGHMKSHMLLLPLPPKHQLSNDSTQSPPSSKAENDLVYGLRENPKKSFKLVDPQFLELGSGLLLQDSDSDTESRSPTRRCLTRVGYDAGMEKVKLKKKVSSTESVNELEDEDVAACLMMLSRDKWRAKSLSQTRRRYKCETCKKEFGTFQGLGGHATSHKKVKKRLEDHDGSMEEKPRKNRENVAKKLHECPVCFRVFGSGQALGGHKRSHFLGSSSTSVSTSSSTSPKQLHEDRNILKQEKKDENMGFSLIDLNWPVPAEYED